MKAAQVAVKRLKVQDQLAEVRLKLAQLRCELHRCEKPLARALMPVFQAAELMEEELGYVEKGLLSETIG